MLPRPPHQAADGERPRAPQTRLTAAQRAQRRPLMLLIGVRRAGPPFAIARLRECRGRARKTAAAAAALANRSGRVKHEVKHKLKGAASLERARRASMRSMRRAGAEEAEERRCGTAGRARSRQREAREQHAALPRARRR
ncbi:hypothetical protein FA09DRAFT_329168 [Tilletiopsis washingtonensis]|uniref:Uncharacterized protein n=1 Tax=Tilletiopsis washingtonensis TaxID=58919 RepID=A0A316ZCJ7_9BASI|nr:hypothetical protein FA09DRAFT_329168 [Tilletiopsis washingtonensis]PWN98652.1 hypothetical protein FA09DRAFT_329168 [Tilletiopsis washingtonensis]